MAALTRKFKKIFAKDSANNGVFGSAAALTPATSTNPETIESLAAFLTGWEDATEGGLRLPTLEDMQGLKYDTDYHLAYIYQTGMQVYNSQTTYYTNDLVRKDATAEIWKSLVDNNTGNALVSGSNWSLVGNLSYLPTATLGTAAYVNTGASSGNVPLVGTQSATTSLAGTIEIATDAEVIAGTDSQRAIVPSSLVAAFANSKATNGYTYLPNGVIYQWGVGVAGSGNRTLTLPIAFPTAFRWVNMFNDDAAGYRSFELSITSLSAFDYEPVSLASTNPKWFAIGY